MKQVLFYTAIILISCGIGSCKSNQQSAYPKSVKNNTTAVATELTDKYWKLTEVLGRPVTQSEAYILLKTDGTISGSLGCNAFNGNYTNTQPSRIRFFNVVNTLKMCIDMRIEDDLKQVLEQADSYHLNGNQLILNRARMSPLARFEVFTGDF
jgi:heat shock protein HslJ